ncbi:MAG TPA: hypothetical protein VK849_14640, partial [Longimicrobiales bacterium]|nr:hypothetical protein [Longimicrobiales bacterium]
MRRRHVFRVGFAYIVVAFALLQGADLVLPALLMPAWTFRLLVLLVLFLFPIVLVLSWVYDLTPAGVTRTKPADRPEDPSSPSGGTTTAVSSASGGSDVIESLAILPFVNAGNNPDGDYLSEGITESIINKMSTIRDVRVVPRASAFRFKDPDMDLVAVGRELGVRVVVTGLVHQRGEGLVAQAEL